MIPCLPPLLGPEVFVAPYRSPNPNLNEHMLAVCPVCNPHSLICNRFVAGREDGMGLGNLLIAILTAAVDSRRVRKAFPRRMVQLRSRSAGLSLTDGAGTGTRGSPPSELRHLLQPKLKKLNPGHSAALPRVQAFTAFPLCAMEHAIYIPNPIEGIAIPHGSCKDQRKWWGHPRWQSAITPPQHQAPSS